MSGYRLARLMLTDWRRRLSGNQFVRSVVTLVSANIVGQVILLAAMPFVTRLYLPSAFGAFAAFNAILSLMLVASSLRYEYAIPLTGSDRNGRIVLLLSLVLNGVVALFVAIGVVLWRENLALVLQVPSLDGWLWLLAPVLLGAGSYKVVRLWAVRRHEFRAIAGTRIVQSGTNAAIQVGGGFLGLGVLGLIIAQFFGYSAGTFRLARNGLIGLHELRQVATWRRLLILARRYSRFPRFDVAAAIVDTASIQAPNLLLASMFGPTVVGFYALADKVLAMPANLLGQAVGQVLLAHSSKAVAEGRINRILVQTVAGLFALMILPSGILFFFGPELFAAIFGSAWRESGVFAGWLTAGATVQLLYSSISYVLLATEGQHLNLYIHLFMLAGKVTAIWYGFMIGSPLVAIIGYSIVNGTGYLGAITIVFMHIRSYSAPSPAKG